MKPTAMQLAQAQVVLERLLAFAAPADQTLSAFFRGHRELGQRDRAVIAEAVYAVLRHLRSLEAACGSRSPRELLLAAFVRSFGLSGRAIGLAPEIVTRLRAAAPSAAVEADLPDWLWLRLVEQHGETEAMQIARGLLQPAPLDLRVNLARLTREAAIERLQLECTPTPLSPAGLRLAGKPALQRHPLFLDGSVEVQDEGSQLLAYLVAPRRGEMVADFCAGAGGKTLALAMLMRGTGRVYAMDVAAKRLAALSPRAARAGVSNIHPIALADENDLRARRLAGKLDRVLVDAPCSGFGTLRRNPDLKWRYGPERVTALAGQQLRILQAAARLVKPGGRLVYATCSILDDENGGVVQRFLAATREFTPLSCAELLAQQRIPVDTGRELRLWPHVHATDGFFAAAFERR